MFKNNVQKRIIGVDIDERSIKIVEIGQDITNYLIKDIPLTETNPEASIIEILKEFFKPLKGSKYSVFTCISGAGTTIRRITTPKMSTKELKEAISWEAKKSIPYPIDSVVIDYMIADKTVENSVEKYQIIFAAVKKDILARYVSIFYSAGIQLSGITCIPFALFAAASKYAAAKDDSIAAIIAFGEKSTFINMFRNNVLLFTREITVGSRDIRQEDILNTISQDNLSSFIKRLTNEIIRSLDYFKEEFHVQNIEKAILTGNVHELKDFDVFLSNITGVKIEILKVADSPRLTLAAGIALNQSDKINFYKTKRKVDITAAPIPLSLSKKAAIGVVSFVIAITFATNVALDRLQKKYYEEQIKKKILAQDMITSAENAQALNEIRNQTIKLTYILKNLSSLLPSNAWLTNVTFSYKDKKIVADGTAPDTKTISDTIKAIEKSSAFKNAMLIQGIKSGAENTKELLFKINMDII